MVYIYLVYVEHSTCDVYCMGSGDALTGSNADYAVKKLVSYIVYLIYLTYLIYRLILQHTRPTVHRSRLSLSLQKLEAWRRDALSSTLFSFLEFPLFILNFSFFFFIFFAFSPFAFQWPHNSLNRSMVRSRGGFVRFLSSGTVYMNLSFQKSI